jgi:hypothetical protein
MSKSQKAPKAKTTAKAERKYAHLTTTFFNGSPLGQLLSIYKTRETNPAKWDDYRAALQNGDCEFPPPPHTKAIAEKMAALGIEVSE